jgi:hypothetical protein
LQVPVIDQVAHWFDLRVGVERYLVLIVDVIELFFGDLNSSARDEYHLTIRSACIFSMRVLTLPSSS